ncbi:MAG: hypothetical protein WAQ33_12170 [Gaiellaceae bacterium]
MTLLYGSCIHRIPDGPFLRLPDSRRTAHEFELDAGTHDRRLAVTYATSERMAIESTSTHSHIDEWADMPRPDRIYQSLEPTFTAPGCTSLIITTGAGPANPAAAYWHRCLDGEGLHHPIFIPATARPDRDQAWLEHKRRTLPADAFTTEYACTWEQALAGSGARVFTCAEIDAALNDPRPLLSRAEPGRKYVIGVDIGSRHDHTVITVLDVTEERIDVAAYLRLQGDYPQLQNAIIDMHQAFRPAFSAIEANSGGAAVCDNLGLPEHELRRFTTSKTSKARIIENLRLHLQQRSLKFHPALTQLAAELRDYQLPDDSHPGLRHQPRDRARARPRGARTPARADQQPPLPRPESAARIQTTDFNRTHHLDARKLKQPIPSRETLPRIRHTATRATRRTNQVDDTSPNRLPCRVSAKTRHSRRTNVTVVGVRQCVRAVVIERVCSQSARAGQGESPSCQARRIALTGGPVAGTLRGVKTGIGAGAALAVVLASGTAAESSGVAAAPGPIIVSCRLSPAPNPFARAKYWFTISNQRPGQIRVTTGRGGLVLAYVDSTSLQGGRGRACRQARTEVRNVSGLSGPWSTNKRNRFACGSDTQRVLRLMLSSVWNAKTRVLADRLLAALGGDTVARVVVTKRGGGIWVDAAACIRLTS